MVAALMTKKMQGIAAKLFESRSNINCQPTRDDWLIIGATTWSDGSLSWNIANTYLRVVYRQYTEISEYDWSSNAATNIHNIDRPTNQDGLFNKRIYLNWLIKNVFIVMV